VTVTVQPPPFWGYAVSAAADPLDQIDAILSQARAARASHAQTQQEHARQLHAAVAPLVASPGQALPAGGAAPAVNRQSAANGCLFAITSMYKYVPAFLLFMWIFGIQPGTFDPRTHTWYYPHVSCEKYDPHGPPVPPGPFVPPKPGPTPGPGPAPLVGPMHATAIIEIDKVTQGTAAITDSPTLRDSLEKIDCAWRVLDTTADQAAITKLGLEPIAAQIGMPVLIIQDQNGRVLSAVKLPATEADVLALATKLRQGGS